MPGRGVRGSNSTFNHLLLKMFEAIISFDFLCRLRGVCVFQHSSIYLSTLAYLAGRILLSRVSFFFFFTSFVLGDVLKTPGLFCYLNCNNSRSAGSHSFFPLSLSFVKYFNTLLLFTFLNIFLFFFGFNIFSCNLCVF